MKTERVHRRQTTLKINEKVFPWHPPPNHSVWGGLLHYEGQFAPGRNVRGKGYSARGKTCPPTLAKEIQVHYSALKKLCALRTRSHWRCSSLFARGHHRARFVHLVYLFTLRLTCSNRLRSRCLSSRRWCSASPSTSDHSPSSSTECFPSLHTQAPKLLRSAAHTNVPPNSNCTWIYACAKPRLPGQTLAGAPAVRVWLRAICAAPQPAR